MPVADALLKRRSSEGRQIIQWMQIWQQKPNAALPTARNQYTIALLTAAHTKHIIYAFFKCMVWIIYIYFISRFVWVHAPSAEQPRFTAKWQTKWFSLNSKSSRASHSWILKQFVNYVQYTDLNTYANIYIYRCSNVGTSICVRKYMNIHLNKYVKIYILKYIYIYIYSFEGTPHFVA